MNKILIVYINDFPYFYIWDGNIISDPDDVIDYIVNEISTIKDFDIVETVLDLETYKELYYEHLHDIGRGQS